MPKPLHLNMYRGSYEKDKIQYILLQFSSFTFYSSSIFIIYISKKSPDLKECGQDERDRGEMGSGSASANGHLPLCPPLLSLIAPCHAHAWALTAVSDAQNPGQAAAQNFVLPRQGKA